jgi:hypothetical protein
MIFCVGSINADFIFAADRWPAEQEKYRADDYICTPGGAAANTSCELSRLISIANGATAGSLLRFAAIEAIEREQDLIGLAPKGCFITAEAIEREIGQIG